MRWTAIVSMFVAVALAPRVAQAQSRADTAADPSVATMLQLRVIEFSDHPDPHTGALRVIQGEGAWPLELDRLVDSLSRSWTRSIVADIRRVHVSAGTTMRLGETTVRVIDIARGRSRISVEMDAGPAPYEATVSVNDTAVIGSEADGQRHAFVALTLLDSAAAERTPEVFSMLEPGITGPVKVSGAELSAPPAALANGQKGIVVQVELDDQGNVLAAHALGHRFLSADDVVAIEKTVMTWKFMPAIRNGNAVRVIANLMARFTG